MPLQSTPFFDLIITRTYGCCNIKLIYLLINLLYAEMTTMMPFIPNRAIPPCPPWRRPLFAAGQDHSGTNANGLMGSGCRRKSGTYGRTPAPLRWCGVLPNLPARCIEGLDHNPHMTPSEAEKRNRSLGSKKSFLT